MQLNIPMDAIALIHQCSSIGQNLFPVFLLVPNKHMLSMDSAWNVPKGVSLASKINSIAHSSSANSAQLDITWSPVNAIKLVVQAWETPL